MKRRQIIPILFAFLFFFGTPLASGGDFKVTRVYDGDTVKAETGEIVIYIALLGIDAPEFSSRPGMAAQPYGEKARQSLAEMVLNRTVVVEGYGTMPYPDKCIISILYSNGKNVNLEMVRSGLAEVERENLPEGFNLEPFLEAEREAKAAKRGMWRLGDEYVSPRDWRRKYGGH